MEIQDMRGIYQHEIDRFAQRLKKLAGDSPNGQEEEVIKKLTILAEGMEENVFSRMLHEHPHLAKPATPADDAAGVATCLAASDEQAAPLSRADEERCSGLQKELDASREEERLLYAEVRQHLQVKGAEEEALYVQYLELCSSEGTGGQPSEMTESLQQGVSHLQQRVTKTREALRDLETRTTNVSRVEAEQLRVESSSLGWLLDGAAQESAYDEEDSELLRVINHLRRDCVAAVAAQQHGAIAGA